MRRLLIATLSLLLLSCAKRNDTFELKGVIHGAQTDEELMLIYPQLKDGVWYRRTLTTKVEDDKFVFEGELSDLAYASLVFNNMDEVGLFIDAGRMTLEMERERPYDFTLQGVGIKAEFEEYRRWMGDTARKMYESNRNVQDANQRWIEASQRSAPEADSLMREFYNCVYAFRETKMQEVEHVRSFMTAHLDYAIVPYMLYYLAFNDGVSNDEASALYRQLPQVSRQSALGQLAMQRIELSASKVGGFEGDKAFDFERNGADGQRVRMSEQVPKGGYLLLDFWASWCAPCIEEMPAVRQLYDKYSDRGLNIIGVSSDADVEAWKKGIEQHGLARYPQVLSREPMAEELFFAEETDIATRYEVTSIPCFILLNDECEVVARWQHFDEQTLKFVEDLFK